MSLISLYTPLHAIRDFDITLIKELATAILAKNEPYSTGVLAICAANRKVNRRCSKLVCVQLRVRGKNLRKKICPGLDSQRQSWRRMSHRVPECWRFAQQIEK